MTALLTLLALTGAGLALLRLARLHLGTWSVDLPLGWFLGQAWFSLGAFALRFLAHLPYGAPLALALALAPPAALLGTWLRRRAGASPVAAPGSAPAPGDGPPRWRPRQPWRHLAMGAFTALVAVAVLLQSLASPTGTDDAERVRAFAPVLALDDGWSAAAREVLMLAGPVPAWVPTFAWTLTGRLDHFHTNAMVAADFLALLLLVIGLSAWRGQPERGLTGAFLACSLPLVVYHATTTLSDVPLAVPVACGLLFIAEFARRGDPDDAVRAMLLLASGALVKREGLVVAGAAAAVLLLQGALARRGGGRRTVVRLLLAGSPVLLLVAAGAAAVGLAGALPVVNLMVARGTVAAVQADVAPPEALAAAPSLFAAATFRFWNHGLIFWALPLAIAARARTVLRPALAWPLAVVALLYLESLVSSIWLVPAYTVLGTTVHRSLIPAALTGSLWLAALLTEPDPPDEPSSPPPGGAVGARD